MGWWPTKGERSLVMRARCEAQAELDEFLAHLEAGNAQPAGGFGLVALSEADGLGI